MVPASLLLSAEHCFEALCCQLIEIKADAHRAVPCWEDET